MAGHLHEIGEFRVVPIVVKTSANCKSYELPDKSILDKRALVKGFYIRGWDDGERRTINNRPLLSERIIKRSHITIKSTTSSEYLREIPLEDLIKRDAQEFWFPFPCMDFDISNSKIFVTEAALMDGAGDYELMVIYELPK